MKNIGVFPGSFNPIHFGHTEMMKMCMKQYKLDEVRIVPAYHNPFKESYQLSFEQRCELIHAHLDSDETWKSHNEKFRLGSFFYVWEIERDIHNNDEPVYFIDTIKAIHAKLNGGEYLTLLLGGDLLHDFHQWKDFQCISNYCNILFASKKKSSIRKALKDDLCSTHVRGDFHSGIKPYGVSTEVYNKIRSWHGYA